MFDYSWGQFMAREAGLESLNFSRGGMSAKWYCDTFADENDLWNYEKKCKAYIIVRGDNKTEERNRVEDLHRELIYKIADLFEFTYVVDLRKHMPITDEFYRKNFKLVGHENAMGYQLFARVVMTYIDYIIRKNTEDFIQIGFVGTEWHNTSEKW